MSDGLQQQQPQMAYYYTNIQPPQYYTRDLRATQMIAPPTQTTQATTVQYMPPLLHNTQMIPPQSSSTINFYSLQKPTPKTPERPLDLMSQTQQLQQPPTTTPFGSPSIFVPPVIIPPAVESILRGISCIIDPSIHEGGLYLSGIVAASDVTILKAHNIKAVITITTEKKVEYPTDLVFHHHFIPAEDVASTNIKENFEKTFQFIEEARRNQRLNVLIHCMAGVSRSASITLAYLMKAFKMPLDDAFTHVRSRRPIINPNQGFVIQLQDYEIELNPAKAAALQTKRKMTRSDIPEKEGETDESLLTTFLNWFSSPL